jgi:class 3 adenylate cyclase
MESSPHNVWIEKTDGTQIPVQGTCSLGRASTNQVVVQDEKVSRRHAFIHGQGDDEWVLVDGGSSNGTYVNDIRVTMPRQLYDGDRIQIGDSLLLFRHPAGAGRGGSSGGGDVTMIGIRAKPCWLLLADIVGSAQLSREVAQEELVTMVGRWFASCKSLIESCKGVINKYLGDGFFAYWQEAPGVDQELVEALTNLRKMQEEGAPRFRLALHYGRVTMGGVPNMGEESLSGADVNFVFRMEKLGGSLKLPFILSEAAKQRLSEDDGTEAIGRHGLPGFSGDYLFFKM